MLALMLIGTLTLAFNIRPVKSSDPEALFFDDFNDGVADGWEEKVIRCYDSSIWEELPSTWSVINGEYFVTLGIIDSGISTVNYLNLTDCIIQTKLRFRETNVGFRAGIIFRFLDDKHYYTFHLTDEYDAIEFTKYGPENPSYGVAGVQVRLPINANVEYTLKVEIKGNTFIGYLNNEEIISWSDDSYTIGKVGLYARRADVFFDNFTVFSLNVITATVDMDPHALNLRSKGGLITAHIELPEGFDVNDINVSTIMLNDTIPVKPKPIALGDYDNDTIPDLMVKFDRQQIINYIMANVDMSRLYEERFMTITLTVTGKLNDGTPFQGSDIIKIISPMPRCWRLLAKLGIYPF